MTFSSIVWVSHGLAGSRRRRPACPSRHRTARRFRRGSRPEHRPSRDRTSAPGTGRSRSCRASASPRGRWPACWPWPSAGPRRQVRAPTYLKSVPRNVISATMLHRRAVIDAQNNLAHLGPPRSSPRNE